MARLRSASQGPAHRILLIDDDAQLLESTRLLLARDGHEVLTATGPAVGIDLARTARPQLILVDYFMPQLTGADVVAAIRAFDTRVQVLLVTGYAEAQPGRKLLRELDIQGYHDKGDGPERLLVLIDATLKHYRVSEGLDRQRCALVHLVESGPAITRLQSAGDLFRTALERLVELVGGGADALVVTSNNGLFIMESAEEGVCLRAGTGRFEGCTSLSELEAPLSALILEALAFDHFGEITEGMIVLPLRTRGGDRGCMLVETAKLPSLFAHVCLIYARQVVQALENLLLYERATHDPLTRLWNRSFGLERLSESLKLAQRSSQPTSVILLDIDHFKHVNDTMGHAAGDLALMRIASALQEACRASDTVCRYGGEEFLVVLPGTEAPGAKHVAEKLCAAVCGLEVVFERAPIPITVSAGVATQPPHAWESTLPSDLIARADAALYRAKQAGRNRACVAESPKDQATTEVTA